MSNKYRAAGLIRDNETGEDRILYVENRKDVVTANADLAYLASLDGYRGGHVEECRPDGFWVIAISRKPKLSKEWQAVKDSLFRPADLITHVNNYPWIGVDASGGIFAHPDKPQHNDSLTGWSLSVKNDKFGEWLQVGRLPDNCPYWTKMLIETKELI